MMSSPVNSIDLQVPSAEELIARARALHPLIRKHADSSESNRRLSHETVAALEGAGLFKLSTPRRYGGYQTKVRTMLDVAAALGEADGSAAWVMSVLTGTSWTAGLFSKAAQDDVFGTTPNARVSGVLNPSGLGVKKVDGGYRVTGRWFWNSGIDHAHWTLIGFPLMDEAGEVIGPGVGLIPIEELKIEETWFVAGMKATGSNCIVVEDVFIPDHRVLSATDAVNGSPATEFSSETLYHSALGPTFSLSVVGPQLGMATAALDFVLSKADSKAISYTPYAKQVDSVNFQSRIGKAAMLVDTAYLHARRVADLLDTASERGDFPDYTVRAQARASSGYAVGASLAAVNVLVSAHGAGSFADSSPLQRIWRDANTAGRHALIDPEVGYEIYGKALLGVCERISPFL